MHEKDLVMSLIIRASRKSYHFYLSDTYEAPENIVFPFFPKLPSRATL